MAVWAQIKAKQFLIPARLPVLPGSRLIDWATLESRSHIWTAAPP
jgi:hypothetical protein